MIDHTEDERGLYLVMSSVYVWLVILAAVLDVSIRKIPNYINFTLLILGVLTAIIKSGVYEGFSSLLAVGTTLLVLLLPFALGVYRGGDVKLCMGMSAWLGIEKGLWVVGLGILGGGGLGLLMLVTSRSRIRKSTVPMAVCFAAAGLWVQRYGIPM